jgi:hypothetical protein
VLNLKIDTVFNKLNNILGIIKNKKFLNPMVLMLDSKILYLIIIYFNNWKNLIIIQILFKNISKIILEIKLPPPIIFS